MARPRGSRPSASRQSFQKPVQSSSSENSDNESQNESDAASSGSSTNPSPSQSPVRPNRTKTTPERELRTRRPNPAVAAATQSSSSEDESHSSGESNAASDRDSGAESPSESHSDTHHNSDSDSGSEAESSSGSDTDSENHTKNGNGSEETPQKRRSLARIPSNSTDLDSPPPKQRKRQPRSKKLTKEPANAREESYLLGNVDVKKWRREEAVRRFRYLLDLSDVFRHFVDMRAQRDPEFRSILDEAEEANRASDGARRKSKKTRGGRRGRKSAQDAEEEEFLEEPEADEGPITVFTESPAFLRGKLRQYQIAGLNWLISLFENSISGILADEMGLGKTFQCISFLAYLKQVRSIPGPHLVIVPKSTLQNWAREFEKWAPELEIVVLSGDKQERAQIVQDKILTCQFGVCITSFELVIREKSALQRFAWQYIIVDEAHRIKNEESILSRIMRALFSRHRLLVTGTPLQNNLHELWALLNFLLPDVFADSAVFDEWFKGDKEEGEGEGEQEGDAKDGGAKEEGDKEGEAKQEGGDKENKQDRVIEQLHRLLSPFLLRRVKADVEKSLLPKREINLYVGMTDMQIHWYQRLLEKDMDSINGSANGESKMRLLNVVMQLRKCCNHPYLFEGAEPGPPFTTDEHLVQNAGKMVLLDKLLTRLKAQGSRVLIFSQMGRMLDILEDYCGLRGYGYCRIDGSTVHEDRVEAIDEFNRPNSPKFLFLLTTRAGGLGINLTTADQVVLYDSDWNPQADLQAMDRAHRIGQTKQVTVYRFVTQNAIEEKVLERAAHKLRLDQLVIQQNRNSAEEKAKAAASKEELVNMIRHGAQNVFDQNKGTLDVEESIEDIIREGETKTQQLNQKYSGLGLTELQNFTFDAPPAQKIVNRRKPKAEEEDLDEYRHHRRRARANVMTYGEPSLKDDDDEDAQYSASDDDDAGTANGGKEGGRRGHTPRPPRQLPLHDFQFFDPELEELQDRELAWYRKQAGIRLAPDDFSEDEEDESEAMNAEIEEATPLTAEERKRKEELIEKGFSNFTKRDFHHYISLVTRFGRQGVEAIVERWPEKDPDEIRRYHAVFCERYTELPDHEKYMAQLEAGETRARQQSFELDLMRQKVASYRAPVMELAVNYPAFTARKSYSEEEDRFLIVQMVELGLDAANLPEKIRDRIRSSGLFDFDWFFLSRTPAEISRRCHTLKMIVCREMGANSGISIGRKRRARQASKSAEGSEDESKRFKSEKAASVASDE